MSDRDDSDTQDDARERERASSHGDAADKDAKDDKKKDDGDDEKKPAKKPGKKPLIILGIVVVVLAIGAFVWWFLTRNQVSTDDAYTDGNAVTIAPKVSGYVVTIEHRRQCFVHQGDLLIKIDPRDYQAQLDQASAQLGLAQAQLHASETQLEVARVQYPAQLAQARRRNSAGARQSRAGERGLRASAFRRYSRDLAAEHRYRRRAAEERAGERRAGARAGAHREPRAAADRAGARDRRGAAAAGASGAGAGRGGATDLSYTELRAPADGWVTKRNVQFGTFLQAGTSILTLVTTRVWVTANFKESQLERMRRATRCDIEVDAYPDLEAARSRRQHPARQRLALLRLPRRKRDGQLREDRAARAGEDPHRRWTEPGTSAAARLVRRADRHAAALKP